MYKNSVVLAAVAVAQFLVALDMAVVNVALPSMQQSLGFAPADLAWVVHVYALTFGGFLLLGGRAADLYGRRRLFVGGLVAFGLASLAGGMAQAPWQLIAARAVQGLAAAAVAPAALAMLATTFPEGRERVRALGVWSAVNAAGGALGVLAGGLLTEYAGWRWVMLVNLPIVGAALALSGAAPAGRPGIRRRLDLLGAVLATSGTGLLVYGVTTARWPLLAVAAALLAAFVYAETRTSSPLLRLGILKSRWVAGANVFVFLAAAGQFAAFYFVSLYMQHVLRMSAAATGAAFLPFSLGVIVGTVFATRLTNGRGPRASLIPGGLLAAAGLAWFACLSPGGNVWADVIGPSIVTSIGFGLCLGPVAAAATTGVAPQEAGTASAVLNSARQLGGCVGLAALSSLAAHRTGSRTAAEALNSGYALGLAAAAALLVLAVLTALTVLPRRPATVPAEEPLRGGTRLEERA
ncbi:MFS transporter [Spirillospora sp. NPDC029432]|uniref:MFS transporter n=1 Tax=Spirillospora sp. NPDC029432 TaxID=3154599 RepID=UPI00345470A3